MDGAGASNPLRELRRLGQSIWLDDWSRALLRDGGLARLIDEDGSRVCANPSIFHKAIASGTHYQDDLARLKSGGLDAEQRYEALVISDIRAACDLLRPVFEATRGDDGYVSLELSPNVAHDPQGSVRNALRLRRAVERDNLLINVPATAPGILAFERLIAQGVSVNVTLMFSLATWIRLRRPMFAVYDNVWRRAATPCASSRWRVFF